MKKLNRMNRRGIFVGGLLSVLTGLYFLTGCADGADFSDAKAVQGRDAKALEDLYSNVKGKWEGLVSNPATGLKPFWGELRLYVVYVQDGVNSDGSAKLRPTLRGRFQPRDFDTETDAMELAGDFERTGQLLLVAQKSLLPGAVPGAGVKTLVAKGVIRDGNASIELTREGGVWGVFQGTRTSADASAPATGLEREFRERALRKYRKIEGSYFGVVKTPERNNYRVEIAISVVEVPGKMPAAHAQYKRLDVPAGTLEWSLDVNYDSQTGEVMMREDLSAGSSVPGGMMLSITGHIEEAMDGPVLNAVITGKSGPIGSVIAFRKAPASLSKKH